MKKLLILMAGLAWVFSCAPFSKSILDQVDPDLTFREIQEDPLAYEGEIVIWGGVIIETLNRTGETLIRVRQTELDIELRPKNFDRSQGRFLIQYHGFLDPAIYKGGRLITVAGEITGAEVHPLGKSDYTYPVISAKEIYLWEILPAYPYAYPPWYYDPYYPWGWYRPYWHHPYWR